MEFYTQALNGLIREFERLPGVGRKTAERLAYYILRTPRDEVMKLAHAIREVKQSVRHCTRCFHVTETDCCEICSDATRDQTLLCVVEQPKDLLSIENSGSFRGRYHVLLGTVAPLDGVRPEELTISALEKRLKSEPIREVIVATNPNFEGDGTALYLLERLKRRYPRVKVTRIARGVPVGGRLEHVGRHTVADALDGRQEFQSDQAAGAEVDKTSS